MGYFVCQEEAEIRRGAESHAITVVGIVVVRVAVVVHIAEVRRGRSQRRTKPPVTGGLIYRTQPMFLLKVFVPFLV